MRYGTLEMVDHQLDKLTQYLPTHLTKLLTDELEQGNLLTVHIHLTSLRYTLSTYLPRYLVDWIEAGTNSGLIEGRFRYGAVMFADVSGFTAMSEKLSALGREGAEEITGIVNDYFDTMLKISDRYRGDLLKFGGDALLIFFEGEAGPHQAVATGLAMQAAMSRFARVETSQGVFPLRMSIGIGSGPVFLATLGSADKIEYAVMGRALANMAQAEDLSSAGQVIVDQTTYEAVRIVATFSSADNDFWLLESVLETPPIPAEPPESLAGVAALLEGDPVALLEQCLAHVRFLDAMKPFVPEELLAQLIIDPQQPTLPGSHRPVTVMFANFYGIDEIIETLGPAHDQTITAILNTHFATMSQILARYGGVVNKVDTYAIGHRIMALFGALRTREDDPERAVRAALEMNQALAEVNRRTREILAELPDLEVDFGEAPLKQRIGLNSGFVFAGNVGSEARREYSVMGDEVNLTARLMGVAQEGQVLISQSTARYIGERFSLSEKESVKVKGKTAPVRNFVVTGWRERPLDWANVVTSPIVGRERELQIGYEAVERSCAGDGRVLIISGTAGIGKTRLAEEIVLAGQSKNMDLLAGTCLSYGQTMAYHPWTDILRAHFGIRPEDEFQSRVAAIQRGLDEIGESVWLPVIGEMLHLDIPDNELTGALDAKLRRQRVLDLTVKLLQARSQQRPLLLVVEDAHWADPASMDLINYVCRNIAGYAILLILPHRPDDGLPDWKSYDHALAVALGDLPDQAAMEIVRGMLGQVTMPAALRELILTKGAGNPFFIEEVVRALIDAGTLEQDAVGNWGVVQNLDRIELPETIHGIIISRIDRLLETDRRILQVASVVGQTFSVRIVENVSIYGNLDEAMDRRLEYLGLLGLTEVESLVSELYRFKHLTTREVIYESQAFEQRRNLHRRIADFIERHSKSLAEDIDNLAYHYYEGQSWNKAMTYNLEAARRAQREFANDIAVTAYRRTLTAATKLTDADTFIEQLMAHESLGEVLTLLGRYEEALTHFSQALTIVEAEPLSVDQTRHLAELCRKVADVYEKRGDYETAFEWLDKGSSYLNEAEPTIEAARIYLLSAGVYHRQGKNDEVLIWCEKSQQVASQIKSREAEQAVAQAYYLMGAIIRQRGDLVRAVDYCRRSVEVYRTIDDIVGLSQAYINLANTYHDQGDWDRAEDSLRRSLAIKETIGDILHQGILANNLANIPMYRGQYDEAERLFKRGLTIWQQLGAVWPQAVTLSNLGQVYIYQGKWAEARSALERSRSIFAEVSSEDFLPELERRWAEFYLKQADLTAALDHVNRSLELALTQDARLEEGMSRRVLGQIHLAQQEWAAAALALNRSLEILNDLDSEYEAAKTGYWLALLDHTQPAADKKAAGLNAPLDQAIEIFEKLGAQADLAEALALKARLTE